MVRMVLTIALLTAVALAQIDEDANEAGMPRRSGERHSMHAAVSQQYDKLRQGTAGYLSVDLLSPEMFAVGSAGTRDRRIMSTVLEFEPLSGFEISRVLYPETRFGRFNFDEKPFRVFLHDGSGSTRFRFKVRALPDLKPGAYTLQAHLKFQYVSDAGISEPQQVNIDVPVELVDRAASVQTVDRSVAGLRGITPAEWTEGVLLAPLAIPLGILMALIGWDGC